MIGFINALADSVKSSKMTETPLTDRLTPIYAYLSKLIQWVQETPPIVQPMRFGNKAFRVWLERV